MCEHKTLLLNLLPDLKKNAYSLANICIINIIVNEVYRTIKVFTPLTAHCSLSDNTRPVKWNSQIRFLKSLNNSHPLLFILTRCRPPRSQVAHQLMRCFGELLGSFTRTLQFNTVYISYRNLLRKAFFIP